MITILLNVIWIIFNFFKQIFFNFDTDINTAPFRWKIHKKTVQAIITWLVMTNGIFSLPGIGLIWFLFGIVVDILLFADTLYMRYYKNPLTVSVIINQMKLVHGIRESVFGVLKGKDFLLLADLPLLAVFSYLWGNTEASLKLRLIYGITSLILGLLWFIYIYSISNRKSYFWNKKRIARDLGILYYHLTDVFGYIRDRLKRMKPLTKEEADKIRQAAWVRKSNGYTGLAKDKNVIVVQIESMQDFLINRTIEENEITPNLNRLMKQNIRLKNMYYQTSVGNTSDAELIFNNSLFPLPDKPACYECQRNTFEAVGHVLKEKGYSRYGFHGNQASFWNRSLMYQLYGYDKFLDNSVLKNDEFIFPGLSDKSFFRQIAEFLKERGKENKFFAFLITLSLHHPYDYFEKDGFPVGNLEGTFLGKYIKGAHYVDRCIGDFIQDLQEKGLYKDTLLIMYGDHSGVPRQYRKELMELLEQKDDDFHWQKLQKVAAFLHLPDQSQGFEITKAVGQIDILPTLLNLLDLDIGYALGTDIFDASHPGSAVTRDRTVITEDYLAFAGQKDALDIRTGQAIPITEEMAAVIKSMIGKLEISDLILEKNALKTLKQK